MNLIQTEISYFKNVSDIEPAGTITLSQFAEAIKHPKPETLKRINDIRQATKQGNKELKSELKKQLPAITPGAVMITRATKDVNENKIPDHLRIKQLTGLMQFDFDYLPYNATDLKNEIIKIQYVVMCAISVSSKGIFGLIKINDQDKFNDHRLQFERDIAKYGLDQFLDNGKGKSPTELRFTSYDPDVYINPDAKIYDRLPLPTKPVYNNHNNRHNQSDNNRSIEFAANILQKQGLHFVDGNKHNYILNLCCILNKMAIPQSKAEAYINTHLIQLSEVKSNCISYPYKHFNTEWNTWNSNSQYVYRTSPPPPPEAEVTTETHQQATKTQPLNGTTPESIKEHTWTDKQHMEAYNDHDRYWHEYELKLVNSHKKEIT